jgi:Utp25, U3 small nucleolar RNA-associated SSU processome protein 25
VRLYSEFLQSDVIVASPLGLTTLLTEAAGAGDAGAADFLTSIEIAVVARADVLLMQNWMHVTEGSCQLAGRSADASAPRNSASAWSKSHA